MTFRDFRTDNVELNGFPNGNNHDTEGYELVDMITKPYNNSNLHKP
jgi:hypothetical protein